MTADGGKYTAIVVSDEFEGKTMVAEQKMVYALVNEHIISGAIHALTIKAYTKAEWADKNWDFILAVTLWLLTSGYFLFK